MPDFLQPGFLSGLRRRRFLTDISRSFTGLALGAMLAQESVARADEHTAWQPPDGQPHFTPKAKSVVWLFMNGGVSHAESFDPKPEITKYAGKSISETPYADTQNPDRLKRREVAFNVELRQKLYPLQVGFRSYGHSGIEYRQLHR
jgi:hypothetical protein